MTEKISVTAKAFVEAQKQFAPAITNSENGFFKKADGTLHKYADLHSCIQAVLDALNEHGFSLLQRPMDCETGVKVETIFMHESGEQISGGVISMPADKNNAQGYGSALTYARRYGLMAACGIAPEDDDGNKAVKSMADKLPQKAPVAKKDGA
jgi:hypothetical protein